MKNTVFSTVNKFILYIGRTSLGSYHDYRMFKEEFPPEHPWFESLSVLVDLGYQGIVKDYEGEQFHIPHKRPYKTKNNPKPTLTSQQKDENREVSKVRIFVEHAIGGMKRFQILVQDFRNRKEHFSDDVIALSAGLWNFLIL